MAVKTYLVSFQHEFIDGDSVNFDHPPPLLYAICGMAMGMLIPPHGHVRGGF